MFRSLLPLVIAVMADVSPAADGQVFEGTWRTTNRKLDGTMSCVVTQLSDEQWRGRFYGVWQGVPFDYTVSFAGPPSALEGSAIIDGANYTWKGKIAEGTDGSFKGSFGGSRYAGTFELRRKASQDAARPTER